MFRQAGVRVLGVVSNMSGFSCPHCGEIIEVFPVGQQVRAALDDLPVLATIPLHPPTATGGDRGQPVVVALPESTAAQAFYALARNLADLLPYEHLEEDRGA
jgi:ATP-binding protein involved in chromosome partitioning